tara:strand:+ start:491 stop:778 length:288 start_codon:yes stop_codon:yes gene_type:complete
VTNISLNVNRDNPLATYAVMNIEQHNAHFNEVNRYLKSVFSCDFYKSRAARPKRCGGKWSYGNVEAIVVARRRAEAAEAEAARMRAEVAAAEAAF